jgi:acyl-coenzyme A thioesterase PaaI-like protein
MSANPHSSIAGDDRHVVRHDTHDDCCVCGKPHVDGLGLTFHDDGNGGVEATWSCDKRWQGYPGRAHGGVIAMVLDGAMTHCLFARDITAVTGRMNVRYRQPLRLEEPAVIRATVQSQSPPLFLVTSEIRQNDQVVARAEAKFMQMTPEHFDDD